MRNDKKGKSGIKRIRNALMYSLAGLKSAYEDESAFRQILFLAILGILIGSFLARDWIEWCILIAPCFVAIKAELINSAIENAIDFTSLQLHPLAKKAKDMGSAIQFIACIFWILIWGSYLWMRFSSSFNFA